MKEQGISRAQAYDIVLGSDGKLDIDQLEQPARPKKKAKAISLEPVPAFDPHEKSSDAQLLHANQLSKQGRPGEALEILQLIVETKPDSPAAARAHYSRASIFRKQGEYPTALKEINKSIDICNFNV